jgi:hypothetical protein
VYARSVRDKRCIHKLRFRPFSQTDNRLYLGTVVPLKAYLTSHFCSRYSDGVVGMEINSNELIVADQEGVFRVYDLRNFNTLQASPACRLPIHCPLWSCSFAFVCSCVFLQTFHLPNRTKVVTEEEGVEARRGKLVPVLCWHRFRADAGWYSVVVMFRLLSRDARFLLAQGRLGRCVGSPGESTPLSTFSRSVAHRLVPRLALQIWQYAKAGNVKYHVADEEAIVFAQVTLSCCC